jgi:hypothetical protein
MAKTPMFPNEVAEDVSFINIRNADDSDMEKARRACEEQWDIFEPYADPEFLVEIRKNFDARYWEMYLTTYFVREGYEVTAPKPGPDIGIRYQGCRIWFEATSPERGAESNPDRVPELKVYGPDEELTFQPVPQEAILLRYLNSISEKQRQYASWLAKGVVAIEDSFVVAINPRRVRRTSADSDPPTILQAAYAVGPPYMSVDPTTGRIVDVGYQFRDKIRKQSGAEVSAGVFLLDNYVGLSGLLCSRVDAVNQPEQMGADFQLVENRKAKAPMPDRFRLRGMFFRIDRSSDGYIAIPEKPR